MERMLGVAGAPWGALCAIIARKCRAWQRTIWRSPVPAVPHGPGPGPGEVQLFSRWLGRFLIEIRTRLVWTECDEARSRARRFMDFATLLALGGERRLRPARVSQDTAGGVRPVRGDAVRTERLDEGKASRDARVAGAHRPPPGHLAVRQESISSQSSAALPMTHCWLGEREARRDSVGVRGPGECPRSTPDARAKAVAQAGSKARASASDADTAPPDAEDSSAEEGSTAAKVVASGEDASAERPEDTLRTLSGGTDRRGHGSGAHLSANS